MKSILLVLLASICSQLTFAQTQSKHFVYYPSNKATISQASIKLLDSIVAFLKNSESYSIQLIGHTDNTGDETKNQELSEARAKSISDYFTNKGLTPSKITSSGLASAQPNGDNKTEEGKAKNRRTEITIQATEKIIAKKAEAPIIEESAPIPSKQGTSIQKSDLKVGNSLVLKNMSFEGGTDNLLMEAKPSLESLLSTMKNNPTLEIEIAGHVCCADDMPLSIARAKAVHDYLISKGIDKSRLKYVGYSRNKPIGSDATEEGRKQNRRVEITILKE
jgi:outer membrane protein OmpA-like peptidoglycan-associated protein